MDHCGVRTVFSRVGAALTLISALFAAGCGGEAVGESGPRAQEPAGDNVAELIFEEAFSEMGRIQVFRDSAGHLSTGLIGGIHDDPVAIRRHLNHSVVEMHRGLRPGIPVPSELFEYDKELVPATLQAHPQPLVARTKDHNDFIDTVCHDFAVSGGSMNWFWCHYGYNKTWVDTYPNEYCPSCGDWSFFWNVENNTTVAHNLQTWIPVSPNCTPFPPGYSSPANTWGYHNWWSGYCSAPVSVRKAEGTANLGVTIHQFQASLQGAL
jgi:hypothetical protein